MSRTTSKYSAAIAFVLCVFSSAFASANDFTFAELKALVEAKDLRSVDEVVPYLPLEYRQSFTLMHRSRSIQHSSPEAPRAILFGNDAKLVLAFNGDVNDAGFDRLEVMEFNESKDAFEFKFIYFADRETKAEVIDNPMNCIGCHGRIPNDLHPDWDVGLIWRGAYGSQDDSFAETGLDPELKVEAANYQKFLSGVSAHARYKHLDFSTPLDSGSRTRVEDRPNLRLGLLLTRLQVKRIARQIEAAAGYEPLRYQIMAQLLGCLPTEVDAKFRADLEAKLRGFLLPIYGEEQTSAFIRDQAPGTADAFHIGKTLGLDLMEWPITAEKRTYAVFDGSFTFKELLAAEMFSRLSRREPRFSPFFETVGLEHSPLALTPSPAVQAIDALGGKLTAKALTACPLLK